MAIKVFIKIVDQDKEGKLVEYKPGIIINLSDKEEKRLIKIGAAEAVAGNTNTTASSDQDENSATESTANNSSEEGPSTAYPGA